jgi:hypothetical protein
MSAKSSSSDCSKAGIETARASPLSHLRADSEPECDQRRVPNRPQPNQTNLSVLLAWVLVGVPIAWGFLETLRDAVLLLQ